MGNCLEIWIVRSSPAGEGLVVSTSGFIVSLETISQNVAYTHLTKAMRQKYTLKKYTVSGHLTQVAIKTNAKWKTAWSYSTVE